MKLAAAAVALAIAAGTATALHRLDSGPENEFQTVAYAGANPFTGPVGTDVPGMVPVAAGGEHPADTPQMYAADPAAPACDATSLLAALQTDPARGTAWAQVQRIAPDQLPIYIQGLTPVVLRSPTAVVDHGYRDGTFVATPAVLAAGTAVFVNSYGQPTVKCFSGNPLTPGESSDPTVTTVTPAAAPIATHTFHHPATGGPVTQPGRPDTTGSGPTPIPTDIGGGIGDGRGGTADPDTPGNPGTPGTPAPPVTGYFEYDGSVMLSDGRLVKPDGSIVTVPTRSAADTTGLPDGGWRDKDGLHYNRDGSRRDLMYIFGNDGSDFFLTPDGQIVDGNNQPSSLPDGAGIIRNYDGSVTYVFRASATTLTMQTTYKDGTRGKVTEGRGFMGGVFVDAQGNRYNNDGSPRRGADLPGGGRIEPDGTNVPPPSTTTNGQPGAPAEPQNGGVVGPRTPATDYPPVDPVPEPGSPQNGGVVGPGVDTGTAGETDGTGTSGSTAGTGGATDGSTEQGSGS